MSAEQRHPDGAGHALDLASRALGAQVIHATDELFADRRHLIDPVPSAWSPATFGKDGQIYDGWETRRSRERPGLADVDHAVIRLGAPGRIDRIVVDTAHFTGNFPEYASVEASMVDGYPPLDDVIAGPWTTIVGKSALVGDALNSFDVTDQRRWTHVRLSIYPDGGVARLRVLGEALPDPRFLTGTVDVAAAVNGGRIADASNRFYSSPANLLLPGRHATIGEGWETARRRAPGNEWVVIALAGLADVDIIEVDTTHFTGNAPGAVRVRGAMVAEPSTTNWADDEWVSREWVDLVAHTGLLPDTAHRFLVVDGVGPISHVRVDIYPDGGVGRVHCLGRLTSHALAELRSVVRAPLDQSRPHGAPERLS